MENSNFKISIIMPVYNVERYLPACLESVVNQTMRDIEIIAVNDGSKDNSLDILEEYERNNSDRMKVFTTENHGVSHARNFGLKKASGEYVLYVDSDDFLELDMCEKLYQKAVKDSNDIVICGRYNVYEREHVGQRSKEAAGTNLINRNFKLVENKYELAHISPFPWDKLFRRSVLEGLEFPEKMRFEDLVLVFEACCRAESIGVVEEPLYNYRRTTQGGFLNSFSEQTLDIVKAFRLLLDFMKKNGYMETYYAELEYMCTRHFLYRYASLFKEGNKGKMAIKLEIIRKTQEFLDAEFPDWRNNHYLKYSSGALRPKLKLYGNKNKMLRMTRIREITPMFVVKFLSRQKKEKKKWRKRLKKWKKSKNRLALVRKKLPILSILFPTDSMKYTRMYEKYPVAPKDIFFESKHGEDLAGNIFALVQELSNEAYADYRILLAMKSNYMPQYKELLDYYGIHQVNMVEMGSKAYLKALATAKYLITDTSFPTYYIKKKEQVYLNTWHGTPLKAMGRIVPAREYALGNVQRNFQIADYLLYQNEFSRDVFLEDYMLKDIYPGTIMLSGYPRNSAFFHKNRYDQIRQELAVMDKQVIVYMPTWRGLLHQKENAKQIEQLTGYFTAIDNKLTDSQVLYVKLHPFVKSEMDYSGYKHIKDFPQQYETYDFLNASDVLVTDYSSIMFDYGVTKRKIILFTYDREEYLNGRGLYIDLNALEFPKADTPDELVEELNKEYEAKKNNSVTFEYPEFFTKFCSYDSANTPRQVIETLLYGDTKEHNNFVTQKVEPDHRKKVFIFFKGLKRDDYSNRLIKLLNSIDTKQYDVYVCAKVNDVKKATELLSLLKKEINYFPITYEINYTKMDYILSKLRLKLGIKLGITEKRIDRIMRREILKQFGDVEFDIVVHHSELDRMVGHMCCLLGKDTIYNFKYFNIDKYKSSRAYRKQVKYFVKRFPLYSRVVATKEVDLLKVNSNNIYYNEETDFPMTNILEEVTQHESRSNNLS